jgi:hypothetical protein
MLNSMLKKLNGQSCSQVFLANPLSWDLGISADRARNVVKMC